jgi:DNA-binding MarR family transcriptional regulator
MTPWTPKDNARMRTRPLVPSTMTPVGRLHETQLKQVLGYQLAQASIAANAVYDAAVGEPLNLHRVEFTLLQLLGDNPNSTAARLAKALNVSAPNMALWLERLQSKGWIERSPSDHDRRTNHLRLTRRGHDVAQRATKAILDGEQAAFTALTDGERAILAELLHKLAACR